MRRSSVLGCVALLTVASEDSSAQLRKLSEVLVHPSEGIESVELAGRFAIVSTRSNGLQVFVNVRDPLNPFVCPTSGYDPLYGDIFGESLYYDGLGGHLFTGHRFGGLTMNDVSTPCASVFPTSEAWTRYMHEGLDVWSDGVDHFLFYGEHPSGGSQGGLRIYDIGAGALNEVGTSLNPTGGQLDGGDLVVSPDGNWCYQICPRGIQPGPFTTLVVYDVSDKAAPAFVTSVDIPGQTLAFDAELVYSAKTETLFLAMYGGGLFRADVSTPGAPVIERMFASFPGFSFQEVELYNDTILLLDVDQNQRGHLVAVNVTDPSAPLILGMHTVGGRISDVKVQDGLTYVTVRDSATDQRRLQIWM